MHKHSGSCPAIKLPGSPRGAALIAGNELENVMKNPSLSDLVGGISSVTLGDEEAKRRGVQKSVLERQASRAACTRLLAARCQR